MTPTDSSGPTLLQLYTPVFALVSTLQANKDFGEPEELAVRTLQLLNNVKETCRKNGKNPGWVVDAQYAVVAFVDESMNRSNWHGQQAWQRYPLAARLGLDANLGEVFFQRLNDWQRSPEPPAELLEVFYVCLALGFRGQYFTSQETLSDIRRRLLHDLTDMEEPPARLSPRAYEKHAVPVTVESFPWLWIVSGAGAFLLILFTIFKILSRNEINGLVESICK
jgi:type VI secretion system protein ImpK